MRILTTANHLDSAGGLERTHLTNAQRLVRRGHRFDLVYVEGGAFTDSWRDLTVTMRRVPTTLSRRSQPVRSARSVTEAVRAARQLEPDIVYVYRYWDLPFAVAVAAGRPTAVVYHLCLPPPAHLPRWLRAVTQPGRQHRVGIRAHARPLAWHRVADRPGRHCAHLGRPRDLCAGHAVGPGGDQARARDRTPGPHDLLRGTHRA